MEKERKIKIEKQNEQIDKKRERKRGGRGQRER